MSNILLNLRNVQVSSQLGIALSLFLGLFSTVSTSAIAQPSLPSIEQSKPPSTTSPVAKILLGQWQSKNPSSGETLTLIFTPENKFFILLSPPSPSSEPPISQQLGYKINSIPQPMHMDVVFPHGNTVRTIFDFTPDNKLRLQMAATSPATPRPTAFMPSATLFQKVSNETTFPTNAQIINSQAPEIRRPASEGKQGIAIMNRSQIAYYFNNNKFASTLPQLNSGVIPETKTYRYNIVRQGNGNQKVMVTAQAKQPGLYSYIGVVFVIKDKKQNITIAGICETDSPSSKPPAIPSTPKNVSDQIQCPDGSHPA